MSDQLRPGGTGEFKLGLNYAAGFPAQRVAATLGYQQLLWILGETVAEAGAMNIFTVFDRPDGGKCLRLCDLRRSDSLIHRARRTRRGHTPTRRYYPARRDARFGACPTLPPPSHDCTPAVAHRRAHSHRRARANHVGALCRIGGGYAPGGVLCRHCGRCHSYCPHRVAAPTPRRERWNGNGACGHRSAPGGRVREYRTGSLAAPCGYPGGAR
jgi:hypothetical protein